MAALREDLVGHSRPVRGPVRARVLWAVQGPPMSTLKTRWAHQRGSASHPFLIWSPVGDRSNTAGHTERDVRAAHGRARRECAAAGHLAMVSHPAEVVALIKEAAEAVRSLSNRIDSRRATGA